MTSKLQCECLEQCPSVAVLKEYDGSFAQVPMICNLTSYNVFDNVGISTLFFVTNPQKKKVNGCEIWWSYCFIL
jgi:hypothetical protein